jgi:hypothetical protein
VHTECDAPSRARRHPKRWLGSVGLAGVVALALAPGVASAGTRSATITRSHARHPTCAQILPTSKFNRALRLPTGSATGTFSSVVVRHTSEWYWPYNRPQAQPGSQCGYYWAANAIPADFQSIYPTLVGTGPVGGANLILGFGLSLKDWRRGRAAAQQSGVGSPADFNPGAVHALNLGHAVAAAYLEDEYSGTGPTYSSLGVYVLTRHHNCFEVYVWDATLPQLKTVIKTVLAYKGGSF